MHNGIPPAKSRSRKIWWMTRTYIYVPGQTVSRVLDVYAWVGVKNFGFTEKQKRAIFFEHRLHHAAPGSTHFWSHIRNGRSFLSVSSSYSFLHFFFFSSASISRALVVSLSWRNMFVSCVCKRRWRLGGRKCRKMPESDICVCRKAKVFESHIVYMLK